MKTNNPIICVDFDGVIHSYSSGWKGIDIIPDDPVPGAIDWLLAHLPLPDALGMGGSYEGPEPVIYSARSRESKGIKAMKKWLVNHGVDEWYFRDDILKFPTQKPAAFLTIDDRAICFSGKFPSSAEIMAFQTWNKLNVNGERIGATGNFPDGKVSAEDEGEISFAIGHNQDHVCIKFGTPVAWMEMEPKLAIQFANNLLKHAAHIRL